VKEDDKVVANLIGAATTLTLGVAVSLINFLISKFIIQKYPDKYSISTVFRSLIQISFLVAVYLIGAKTPADSLFLLIGAVLGLSVSSFFFTYKLLKINKEPTPTAKNEKEGETDG